MNDVLSWLRAVFSGPPSDMPSYGQAVVAIATSFVLAVLILRTYRATYRGLGYDPGFAQTLILMSVATAIVMMVIGSSIARAFSLVGSLSIIRFRTAVRDPRDVAFLLFAIVAGMAVGTRFYAIALAMTCLVCAIAFALTRFDIGGRDADEVLLRVVGDKTLAPDGALREAIAARCAAIDLLGVDTLDSELTEYVYTVRLDAKTTESALIESLRSVPGLRRASLLPGAHLIQV